MVGAQSKLEAGGTPRHSLAQPGAPERDDVIRLSGASWSDFERILELRGDRRGPRVSLLRGELELVSPSRSHERYKSTLGRLLEAWCIENGIDVSSVGSWTLRDPGLEVGLEPDECYLIEDRRSKVEVEADEPQRPDLAIEVIWTSGGVAKLEAYRALGVSEVWMWQDGRIRVFVLEAEGYVERSTSRWFPSLELSVLEELAHVQPMTEAIRQLKARWTA